MLVKGLRLPILGIYKQRECCYLPAGLQAALDCTAHQQLAQALASLVGAAGQPRHPKTGNRVARQLLSVGIFELQHIDLRCAEGVVAQDQTGVVGVHQHMNSTHTLLAMLHCKSVKVRIKLWHATAEASAVMKCWVQRLLFKHALPWLPLSKPL